MDYVLQLLPIFIMMAEGLMGGGTGPAKKAWVVQQIENVVNTLILNEAQKDETWAQVLAVLNMTFPDPPEVPEEPARPQSFLGKLIDLFAGLFAK
jgi:hypothetical protein